MLTRILSVISGVCLSLSALVGMAQQPQTQSVPISPINAQYANGVAPGYWPTAGTGLTLNVSGGTADCLGTVVQYTAGTLTMTASTTNYVYLNAGASCVPAVKTTAFGASDITIGIVATSSSAITSITDVRTPFVSVAPSSGVSGFTALASAYGGSAGALSSTACTTSPSGCFIILDTADTVPYDSPLVIDADGLLENRGFAQANQGALDVRYGGDMSTHYDAPGGGGACVFDSNFAAFATAGLQNGCMTWYNQITAPGQNLEGGVLPYSVGSYVNQAFTFNQHSTTSGSKNVLTINAVIAGAGEVNIFQSNPQYRMGQSEGDSEHFIQEGFEPVEAPDFQGQTISSTPLTVSGSTVTAAASMTFFKVNGGPVGNELPLVDLSSTINISGATQPSIVIFGNNKVGGVNVGSSVVSKSTAVGNMQSSAYVYTAGALSTDGKHVIPYMTDVAVQTTGTNILTAYPNNYGTFAVGQMVTISGSCCFIEHPFIHAVAVGGNAYSSSVAYKLGQVVSSRGLLYGCTPPDPSSPTCPAGTPVSNATYWTGEGTATGAVVLTVPLRYSHYGTGFPVCQAGLVGYGMEVNNQTTVTGSGGTADYYTYEYKVLCSPGSTDSGVTTTDTFYAASVQNGNIVSGDLGIGDGNITLHPIADVYAVTRLPQQGDSPSGRYTVDIEEHLGFPNDTGVNQSEYPFAGVQLYRDTITAYDKTGSYVGMTLQMNHAAANGFFFNLFAAGDTGDVGHAVVMHMTGPYDYAFDSPSNGPNIAFANLGCPARVCTGGHINLFSLDKEASSDGDPVLVLNTDTEELTAVKRFNMSGFVSIDPGTVHSSITGNFFTDYVLVLDNTSNSFPALLTKTAVDFYDKYSAGAINNGRIGYAGNGNDGEGYHSSIYFQASGSRGTHSELDFTDLGVLKATTDGGSTYKTFCDTSNYTSICNTGGVPQTMGGDISGTTAAATVAHVNGIAIGNTTVLSEVDSTLFNLPCAQLTSSGGSSYFYSLNEGTGACNGNIVLVSGPSGAVVHATSSLSSICTLSFSCPIFGEPSTGTFQATTFVQTSHTPSSSSDTCKVGQFSDDQNYHYYCYATNTWVRVALTTW